MLRPLTITLVLSSSLACAAKDIHFDRGGPVIEYIVKMRAYEARGEPIRILGTCYSACSIYIASRTACVGPNASIHFHRAFPSTSGSRAQRITDQVNSVMQKYYPKSVRLWIRKQGGLRSNFITLRGQELLSRVRNCRRNG